MNRRSWTQLMQGTSTVSAKKEQEEEGNPIMRSTGLPWPIVTTSSMLTILLSHIGY